MAKQALLITYDRDSNGVITDLSFEQGEPEAIASVLGAFELVKHGIIAQTFSESVGKVTEEYRCTHSVRTGYTCESKNPNHTVHFNNRAQPTASRTDLI